MATIDIQGVSKGYASRRVHADLNLSVRHGECFTLLGPSGCGKTVLLRLIAGFEQPESGRILINGAPVSDPAGGTNIPPDRRDLGVVFQDYAVWPHMTVLENVAYPLKLAKKPRREMEERALEAVTMVGMKGLEKRLPSELSGGQQQRVALARALVAGPSLMLLDEPLTNLDANLREEMRFEIKELQRKLGITVFYVTHDQEIALAISDRLAIMDGHGRVRQIGSPQDIFERPADVFVFNFMGIANFIPVRRVGDNWLVGQGDQRVPVDRPDSAGERCTIGCRPSDVRIAASGPGLRGMVRRASFLGAMMDYQVEVDGVILRVALETHEAIAGALMFKAGDPCALNFHDLLWFDSISAEDMGGA